MKCSTNAKTRSMAASCRKPAGTRRHAALALAAALCCASVPALAQVTYFDKPPSAAQLREALMGGAPRVTTPPPGQPARPDGTRTRGIVWNQGGGMPANQPAPTAAAASAAASVQAPIYARQAGPAAGMPINFASGSSQLAPDSIGFISTVAEVLRGDPTIFLVIEGHTDATGSYKRNMVLSWERAMGVYRVLVESYGIDPKRLQPVGKGPTDPMPGTQPEDGSNRRVQFRLSG